MSVVPPSHRSMVIVGWFAWAGVFAAAWASGQAIGYLVGSLVVGYLLWGKDL